MAVVKEGAARAAAKAAATMETARAAAMAVVAARRRLGGGDGSGDGAIASVAPRRALSARLLAATQFFRTSEKPEVTLFRRGQNIRSGDDNVRSGDEKRPQETAHRKARKGKRGLAQHTDGRSVRGAL